MIFTFYETDILKIHVNTLCICHKIHSYTYIYIITHSKERKGFQRPKLYLLTTELETATLIKDAPAAVEDGALFKEASPSLWEQHVASCLTLLLLIDQTNLKGLKKVNLENAIIPIIICSLVCIIY